MPKIILPSFLEPYWEALEKSRTTYFSIEATKTKEELFKVEEASKENYIK